MSKLRNAKNEAQLAREYDQTRDLSGFEGGDVMPVDIRRSVTISVRFSEDEINALRNLADDSGVKVTAYIRAAALQQASPVDRAEILAAFHAASAAVARAEKLLQK